MRSTFGKKKVDANAIPSSTIVTFPDIEESSVKVGQTFLSAVLALRTNME